ncbi:MAG: heme NO-binding domain-containing protein [Neomegalonema sp.]|nr:heme NO-binding domain-containing protein [Neomegalonema sp.]
MKGVIFTEFVAFVELEFGEDAADRMIESANPPSGGAYTAVGQYPFSELALLVTALAKQSARPAPALIQGYGRYLFQRLAASAPEFLEGVSDPIAFLESVETHIHVEVKKLYPEAQLPSLAPRRIAPHALELEYRSCRPLGALCIGLIEGCADHFGAKLTVSTQTHPKGMTILVEHENAVASACSSQIGGSDHAQLSL